LTVSDIIINDDFKLFEPIGIKVENICKEERKDKQIQASENQPNSGFSYFASTHDLICNCYLCRDLGEFKMQHYENGNGDIK
jgi:hypothetical protein